MIDVLTRPADQVGMREIESLVQLHVPEGEQIEFKESLPSEGNTPDPWMDGKDQIGKPAKDKILKEGVAFANAHGGTLLLGIEESRYEPTGCYPNLASPTMCGFVRAIEAGVP